MREGRGRATDLCPELVRAHLVAGVLVRARAAVLIRRLAADEGVLGRCALAAAGALASEVLAVVGLGLVVGARAAAGAAREDGRGRGVGRGEEAVVGVGEVLVGRVGGGRGGASRRVRLRRRVGRRHGGHGGGAGKRGRDRRARRVWRVHGVVVAVNSRGGGAGGDEGGRRRRVTGSHGADRGCWGFRRVSTGFDTSLYALPLPTGTSERMRSRGRDTPSGGPRGTTSCSTARSPGFGRGTERRTHLA